MIIYRFERNGIGPYVGGVPMRIGSFFGRDHIRTRSQKKAIEYFERQQLIKTSADRVNNWNTAHACKDYMYGCKSKEQLRAYFGGEFKHLFQAGYRIKRYYAPDDEVIDMVVEVAFPVKYHKLKTLHRLQKTLAKI